MNINDICVNYQKFNPTECVKQFMDSRLQEIYSESPDGSTLIATFTRDGKVMKCMIRINSLAGSFIAKAKGSNPTKVAEKVVDQTRKVLNKRKSTRFEVPISSLEKPMQEHYNAIN